MAGDTLDHLHRLDDRTFHIADRPAEEWEAAERYVRKAAVDVLGALGALGFGGRDDTRTKAGAA